MCMFHTVFHKSLTLRDQLKCLLFSSSRSDKVPMVLTCLEQVTHAVQQTAGALAGNILMKRAISPLRE